MEQIARNMGVGIRTLYKWQQESVQFMQALKKGREVVDIIKRGYPDIPDT